MPTRIRRRGLAVTGLVLLLFLVPMAPASIAAQTDAEPAFLVDVGADGSAVVTVRSTFDLATEAERQAFETLEHDDQARARATARFRDRLAAVASDAENATGREMRVTDASIDLQRTPDNETGVIALSVTWEGLATVSGQTLRVTEPFASGFEPDRPFVIRAPDGFEIVSATPGPDAAPGASATWDAGRSLDGFEVVLEPAPTPTPTTEEPTQSGGQPGFGPFVSVVGVLLAASAGVMKRRFG